MSENNGRPTATAMCGFCAWSAKHTDDDPVEVARFLRALLIKHTEDKHPERLTAPNVVDNVKVQS